METFTTGKFSKIMMKMEIFANFDENGNFRQFCSKMEIFVILIKNLMQNCHNYSITWPNY